MQLHIVTRHLHAIDAAFLLIVISDPSGCCLLSVTRLHTG